MLLGKTQVEFPVLTSDGLQTSVTPVPPQQMALSGLCEGCTRVQTYTHLQTHALNKEAGEMAQQVRAFAALVAKGPRFSSHYPPNAHNQLTNPEFQGI